MRLLERFRDWDDIETFRAGKEIFKERTPGDAMYIILSGEVELTLYDEPLGIESEGGVIGEMAMLGTTTTRSATATTLTKVKLARLDREQFRELIRENTDFALLVMDKLANRLRAANDFIARQFA
jgi:CRP-like cAMP-binding protein